MYTKILQEQHSCRIPYVGAIHGSELIDVSIETIDGRCGLSLSACFCDADTPPLLGYRYDNIFFAERESNLVIAVQNGRYGLYALECNALSGDLVTIRELLPCSYNRLEPCRLTHELMLVYGTGGVMWLDTEGGILSREYSGIAELAEGYLLLEREGRSMLLNTRLNRIIYSTTEWDIRYECEYQGGQVFRLAQIPCGDKALAAERLLFADEITGNVSCSPVAEQVKLTLLSTLRGPTLSKVVLSWGDGSNPLSDRCRWQLIAQGAETDDTDG